MLYLCQNKRAFIRDEMQVIQQSGAGSSRKLMNPEFYEFLNEIARDNFTGTD